VVASLNPSGSDIENGEKAGCLVALVPMRGAEEGFAGGGVEEPSNSFRSQDMWLIDHGVHQSVSAGSRLSPSISAELATISDLCA